MPPEAIRWPLTGLSAPSIEAVDRAPLSVTMNGNAPSAQVGLNDADIVYEWENAGAVQLNALFQSTMPPVAGPVADATLLDTRISTQFRALLFSKGATSAVTAVQTQEKLPDLSNDGGLTAPYVSVPRVSRKGVFLDTRKAYTAAQNLGIALTGEPARLRFDAAVEATQPILGVSVPLSDANTVSWTWKPSAMSYVRRVGAKEQTDALSHEPLRAKNVVVMWVKKSSLDEADPSQTASDTALAGSGQVSVFRDGVRQDGTWKASSDVPPRFFAEDGAPIALGLGNTWVEVIPSSASIMLR